MNTSQLECFIKLAGTLNFVKTAEALGLTQPAVSKQIRTLETELGCKLFHRTTRSVTLTKVGASFLTDAHTMLDTFYHSKERISGFLERERHALRIGYMDPHAIRFIGKLLTSVLLSHPNIIPAFTQDQTDSNLRHLLNNRLDLIIGIKDAKFHDSSIAFTKLRDEHFLCLLRKDSPAALSFRQRKLDAVSTEDLWEQRQVIAIPPYLLRNFFARGRHIVPVNDEAENAICSNANEAYALLLAGFGYAYLPEHEITPHPELVAFRWQESPHAPFGIYSRASALKDSSSPEYAFIQNAKKLCRP